MYSESSFNYKYGHAMHIGNEAQNAIGNVKTTNIMIIYFIARNWGGKLQGRYFGSNPKTPAVIRGCPVCVVDCTRTLEFSKPSKEVDWWSRRS